MPFALKDRECFKSKYNMKYANQMSIEKERKKLLPPATTIEGAEFKWNCLALI